MYVSHLPEHRFLFLPLSSNPVSSLSISDPVIYFCPVTHTAVHCNLSQNGIDHQMCPEDMTSQLEEEEESVDAGAVLLDDDSPSYQDISPPMYQRRSPPHRSVSESELSRVRVGPTAPFKASLLVIGNQLISNTSPSDFQSINSKYLTIKNHLFLTLTQ